MSFFQTTNHMTVVQKWLKIVCLEGNAKLSNAEYLDNETADNESVSDKWQCNAISTKVIWKSLSKVD